MNIIEKVEKYVKEQISIYKKNSEDHYDFWNEHIKYVYVESLKLAEEYNADKEIVSLGKNVSEVSFNIDVEAEILKKGKRKNKKDIKRKIRINGPIVNIFKPQNSNEELKIMEDKSYFDLRYIKLEDNEEELNNQINNYNRYKKTGNEYTKKISEEVNLINQPQIIYRQKFSINKIKKDEKEIKKPIIFYSNKIEEFQNKSLASLLIELQNYYKEFLFNVENASYKSLKFLSNPNCQIFELHPLECQKLLNNLYWHPKVQILSIPTSFIASLKIVMDARNWECNITTLTVIQDMGVSSPTFEESIFNLFSGINSIPIQNIHFIDVPYNKKIANALFKHIEVFYSITNDILNTIFASKPNSKRFSSNSSEKDFISNEEIDKIDNPKTKLLMSLQKTKLPIINLSWKKTPNSKLSKTNFEEAVDLRGIYYILMDMLIKAYKFNNHKLPEVFNKLDISETTVTDDVVFLVKIITQFKIIKELDISNTKLFSSGKVINSDNFLKKIKLTNDIDGIFNSEEEAKFMDETMKEISFFKYCTEQERNNLPINLKDEQICYNYFMGIFPILEKLYVYNTDIKESVARDIYVLFKKLKFFQGFYCSSSTNNNILLTTINSLANIIQSDSSSFCENVFKINN